MADQPQALRLIAENRKARFKFEVLETVEAGLVLLGTEVKSLREGKVSLDEAYGRIDEDVAFLVGAFIPEYSHGNLSNHDPIRRRKLLLHRRELAKLREKVKQRGFTLVPLSLYWSSRNLAKVKLGLCRGKKIGDKRETMKKKDAVREIRDA